MEDRPRPRDRLASRRHRHRCRARVLEPIPARGPLAGGVAAVSGALLTLILDAAMSGSCEDPSTVPIVISFAGAASVSAVLHVRMTELQAERERHVDRALAALASRKDLAELEARLVARHETATDVHGSWRVWWRSRPRSR